MQELGESPLRGPGRKEHREFVERLERATPHLAVGTLAGRWRRI